MECGQQHSGCAGGDSGASAGGRKSRRVAGVHRAVRLHGANISYRLADLCKKIDPYAIQEGQPITFMLDENTVATHRVVGIVPDEEDPTVIRFRTKGDANEAEDARLVHYKNVIGTPVFSIPYLGYATNYIQHPPGMYVAISAGAILLLLMFLPDMFPDDRDEEIKLSRPGKGRHTAEYKAAASKAASEKTIGENRTD